MAEKNTGAITGEPISNDPVYSLEDLGAVCNVETAWIIELIEHGLIEARGTTASEWRFSSLSVVRLAKAKRLDQDLGVNPAGIALAFDLLAEIDRLRAHLGVLKSGRTSLSDDRSRQHDLP